MTIDQMIRKSDKFRKGWLRIVEKSIREHKGIILELQKSQLLTGKDKNMVNLSPTYLADNFFKDSTAAKRYKDRKDEQAAFHESLRKYKFFGTKDGNVPNLIYTGKKGTGGQFQKGLRVDIGNDMLKIFGTWSKSPAIESKYPNALGLSPQAFKFLWDTYILPDVIDYWNNLT